MNRIRSEPDKTFLIQSKNPQTFERIDWPKNVILGTTIETNRHNLAGQVSKAPPIINRWIWWGGVKYKRMLTIEPILDFDIQTMLDIVDFINPLMVWIGYDTKKTGLLEPPIEKVKELHWQLSKLGFTVMLKNMR